jgi:hypothetical protein
MNVTWVVMAAGAAVFALFMAFVFANNLGLVCSYKEYERERSFE